MENQIIIGGKNLEELKTEYLNYIDVSSKTLETYDIALKQFSKYILSRGIENPLRSDVIAFKEEMMKTHKVTTVNSYLIALRNFFKFLSYNEIYKDITENIKGLKDTDIHKREALSVEMCNKVLQGATDLREKLLFTLTLSCGLRANEVVNIEISDIKYEEGQYRLYVLGKGRNSKLDYVIVPDSVFELIKEYVEKNDIKDYLFVSTSNHNNGGKLTPTTVRRIINKMFERAGIKSETIVFHSLRHSFATISIENGQDIRQVSQALRHKSVQTTERYLHDLNMKNNKCSNVVINCLLDMGER